MSKPFSTNSWWTPERRRSLWRHDRACCSPQAHPHLTLMLLDDQLTVVQTQTETLRISLSGSEFILWLLPCAESLQRSKQLVDPRV